MDANRSMSQLQFVNEQTPVKNAVLLVMFKQAHAAC